jgi:archaemetzincin
VSAFVVVAIGPPDDEALASVEVAVANAFGRSVARLAPLPEPAGAFDAARGQWSAPEMLKALLRGRPPGAERILGVTGRDLFIPVLSFVFGQAQMDGPTAVISLARLSQAFSGFPEDRPLLLERARKEALHELGHTFGLVHCPDTACPMSLSTGVVQVDRKGEAFCASCAALVRERTPAAVPPPEGRTR